MGQKLAPALAARGPNHGDRNGAWHRLGRYRRHMARLLLGQADRGGDGQRHHELK